MDIDETRYYRVPDGRLLKLEICRDTDSPNPRTEWDNTTVMVCFHSRYSLGDYGSRSTGPTPIIKDTVVRYDNSADGAETFAEWAKEQLKRGEIVIASLELYDHSGITMRIHGWGEDAFSAGRTGWDSGIVGWCFVTKQCAEREIGIQEGESWQEIAKRLIESDVRIYDEYLTGEVYGYRLYELPSYMISENGVDKRRITSDADWTEIDSCWGYYGHDHEKSGVLECIPQGATRIYEKDLPGQAKEAA